MNWKRLFGGIAWINFFGLAWLLITGAVVATLLNMAILGAFFLVAAFATIPERKPEQGEKSNG